MFSENADEKGNDEVSGETDQYVIIVFYFSLWYWLDFFEENVLVFVHELCAVLYWVQTVSVTNNKERPNDREYKTNETHRKIEPPPWRIIMKIVKLHESWPTCCYKLISPDLIHVVERSCWNVPEKTYKSWIWSLEFSY